MKLIYYCINQCLSNWGPDVFSGILVTLMGKF